MSVRYHKISDGFKQNYQVIFRFSKEEENFPEFYNSTWRWAWEKLNPEVKRHDIAQIRKFYWICWGKERLKKKRGLVFHNQ